LLFFFLCHITIDKPAIFIKQLDDIAVEANVVDASFTPGPATPLTVPALILDPPLALVNVLIGITGLSN
jgi:hypothetical protein